MFFFEFLQGFQQSSRESSRLSSNSSVLEDFSSRINFKSRRMRITWPKKKKMRICKLNEWINIIFNTYIDYHIYILKYKEYIYMCVAECEIIIHLPEHLGSQLGEVCHQKPYIPVTSRPSHCNLSTHSYIYTYIYIYYTYIYICVCVHMYARVHLRSACAYKQWYYHHQVSSLGDHVRRHVPLMRATLPRNFRCFLNRPHI